MDIVGTDSNDSLRGTFGPETIKGLGGDDTLDGIGGADLLLGGPGNDLIFDRFGANANQGDAGNDYFIIFSTIEPDTGPSPIVDEFDGGAGVDWIDWSDSGQDGGEFDLLAGTAIGDDANATEVMTNFENLKGTGGFDIIRGTDGANVLYGLGDMDDIFGRGGDDTIFAGEGADIVFGMLGDDQIYGGAGNDLLRGNEGDDQIYGEDGADALEGGDGADYLEGGASDDALRGEGGADTLKGGGGFDQLVGGPGADLLDGGLGGALADFRFAPGSVSVNLDAGIGQGGDAEGDRYTNITNIAGSEFDDTLIGDGGDNAISGRDGADLIVGGAGDDTLRGANLFNDGNDTLKGGGGDDLITSGIDSRDVYIFSPGDDRDVYEEFDVAGSLEDVILLAGFGANFDSLQEVVNAAFELNGDTIIDFGGGDSITLPGISIANLEFGNFDFA